MSKVKLFFGISALIAAVAAVSIFISFGRQQYTSASIIVTDNNYYTIPFAYASLEGNGYKISHSVNNGQAPIGQLPKGNYEIKVWLGELNRVEHLLYSGSVLLGRQKQYVQIQLHNVTQRIQILVAEPNITIPVSLEGESIKIQRYQRQSKFSGLAISPVVVNGVDCTKYLFNERFYKTAAGYAYQDEVKYLSLMINTQWFSQKARDARMDYELCVAGVPLRDYN